MGERSGQGPGGEADGPLCRLAKQGDADALEALLARHGPSVRRFVRGRLPRALRSLLSEDDLMQETYAEAFLSIHRLDLVTAFEAWLRQIARNNLRDAVRGLNALRRGGGFRRLEPAGGRDGAVDLFAGWPTRGRPRARPRRAGS